MSTYSEYYQMLKPEDKAFTDGFMCAVEYLEERGELVSYNFMPALPDGSVFSQVIDEIVKSITTAQVEQLNAYVRDLVFGTVDSYE